jgi:hypothetical protein
VTPDRSALLARIADGIDPLPLRNIETPREVTAVEGCTCGGLEWHRAQTIYDEPGSGCAIFSLPPEQAKAAVDDALDRSAEFTSLLNDRLRSALASLEGGLHRDDA